MFKGLPVLRVCLREAREEAGTGEARVQEQWKPVTKTELLPIMGLYGDLTGEWYVTTQYRPLSGSMR